MKYFMVLCITLPKLMAAAGPPRRLQARPNKYFWGHDASVSIPDGLRFKGSDTGGRYVMAHSPICEPIRALRWGSSNKPGEASEATAGSFAGTGAICSMSRRLICASIRMSSRNGEGFERLFTAVLRGHRWRARVAAT